jgi:ring-1,2-phenylacetyl-CoA epoxidase subunit PaaE
MSLHFYKLTVKDVRKETPDTVSISLEIPSELKDRFRFTPGQNIAVRRVINGEECRRNYSICTEPGEPEFRIAVKQIDGGRFSTWANTDLKVGEQLEVMSPSGSFHTPMDPAARRHYVAFAAGSGITPVMSIMKATLAREPQSSFTMVYGNRDRQHIIFREELESLKNRYLSRMQVIHVLSREAADTDLHSGRIDEIKCTHIDEKIISFRTVHAFFLCGPEAMIHALRDCLIQRGVAKERIHFELFHTSGVSGVAAAAGSEQPADAGPRASVSVRHDGILTHFELPYHGETILQAALKKGIDLPFACKGGMCCTCRAKLVEGTVEMDRNYALEAAEVEAGFILTCQSHPRSGTILVDFDVR